MFSDSSGRFSLIENFPIFRLDWLLMDHFAKLCVSTVLWQTKLPDLGWCITDGRTT